jgi:hypothetical protein
MQFPAPERHMKPFNQCLNEGYYFSQKYILIYNVINTKELYIILRKFPECTVTGTSVPKILL